WNPKTEKGLLATLRRGDAIGRVAEALEANDRFFQAVEQACDRLISTGTPSDAADRQRGWKEIRIGEADLVVDELSLPLERVRDSISALIKMTSDKESGEELSLCNSQVLEMKNALQLFLKQETSDQVYWVERAGKTQRQLVLNAVPI